MTILKTMRNIVFLNLINSNSYSRELLPGDRTIYGMVNQFTASLPDVEKIIPIASDVEQVRLFYGEDKSEEIVFLDENRQDLLLKIMAESSRGYDHCFYYFSDTPLLDMTLFNKMYSNHIQYYADYTFADGYPSGMAPEIICSRTLIELNRIISEKADAIDRDSLFSWIQEDINSFDIETEISPVDLRLRRICLAGDSKINFLQLKNFMNRGIIKAADFMEKKDLLEQETRTLPNYYQIQINSSCPQSCSYCPYPGMNPDLLQDHREMPLENILKLAVEIENLTPEAKVSLSLWGEPSQHSLIYDVLGALLNQTNLNFVIETSGLGWKEIEKDEKKWIFTSERIEWIISLDAMDEVLYRNLRGEGQQEVLSTIEKMLAMNPAHTWIQSVRMKENEEDLEKFYRFWKEKTENVIIQKYDYFSKRLPEKKITDLSPLKRFPCWHLKREMAIMADGTVLLCREDISMENKLGNCFDHSLETLWKKGETYFQDHINGDYRGICAGCDEYYSYNF